MTYVVCNRLLDPEMNRYCEFDGNVPITNGAGRCPGCGGVVYPDSPDRDDR
jgi:hypothetical protein